MGQFRSMSTKKRVICRKRYQFYRLYRLESGRRKEIFSKEELIKEFSLERIQKSAGIFNPERLDWYNGQYIRKTKPKKLAETLLEYLPEDLPAGQASWKKIATENFSYWLKIAELEKDRITKLADIKGGSATF